MKKQLSLLVYNVCQLKEKKTSKLYMLADEAKVVQLLEMRNTAK